MKPYYDDGARLIFHGDAREITGEIETLLGPDCVVVDPPYDDPELFTWAHTLPPVESLLVLCDPRTLGDVVVAWGPPTWVFTWDTMSPWNLGARRPLNQTRFACWYGDGYDRDAALWGDAPPARDHPTTKQTPLDGRRLTDLYRESLRWLHHPAASSGAAGTERFSTRQGDPALRHAKPVAWIRCLLGNTSAGQVFDPFLGSGTTLRAAKDLGRRAIGIDVDERCCELAARRLDQEVFDFEVPA